MNTHDLKTPYFIIDKKTLNDGVKRLKNALKSSWGNTIIGYSYKTNSLPWIIKYFKEQGCYAEVVSDDEYNLARSTGIEKNHIIYNGVAKSKETFLTAIKDHAIVNIDAEYEIHWLDELQGDNFEIGIRVNFDLESKCPGQTQCGIDGERFGFCYENGELKKAIEKINKKGIKIVGLHLHKSSKTRMPDIYHIIAEISVEIARAYNLNLKYIDIGGGFFGGLDNKPSFPEYFNMVSQVLRQQFNPDNTALIVEPGMALIGAAVDYVTTVLDIKKTNRNTFVITDGSRIQIDPLMTKSSYFYDVIKIDSQHREKLKKQIVSGFTCMEHDRLFELKEESQLVPGDRIIYHKVGAYTMCLSPLFIKWFPDIYIKSEEKIDKIRKKWETIDYINCNIGEQTS